MASGEDVHAGEEEKTQTSSGDKHTAQSSSGWYQPLHTVTRSGGDRLALRHIMK
jgi:hypothetical protein